MSSLISTWEILCDHGKSCEAGDVGFEKCGTEVLVTGANDRAVPYVSLVARTSSASGVGGES